MRKFYYIFILLIFILSFFTTVIFAATGCSLNAPDRDIKRIFKDATNYKTEFISVKDKGGEVLKEEMEQQLGAKFDPIYESIDVPYTYYTVLKKKEVIGYVHGVNQKSTYGGMQIILATDLDGKIIDFYYQKISSPEAKIFRSKKFTEQFVGLNLQDFYKEDVLDKIKDYTKNSHNDFKATIRGIKKNLLLFERLKMGGIKDVKK